jgi:hypothetical protein
MVSSSAATFSWAVLRPSRSIQSRAESTESSVRSRKKLLQVELFLHEPFKVAAPVATELSFRLGLCCVREFRSEWSTKKIAGEQQGHDLLTTIRQGFGELDDARENRRAPILGCGHAGDELPGRIHAPIGLAIEACELLGVEHPAYGGLAYGASGRCRLAAASEDRRRTGP